MAGESPRDLADSAHTHTHIAKKKKARQQARSVATVQFPRGRSRSRGKRSPLLPQTRKTPMQANGQAKTRKGID